MELCRIEFLGLHGACNEAIKTKDRNVPPTLDVRAMPEAGSA
jgi:hypothetical protein